MCSNSKIIKAMYPDFWHLLSEVIKDKKKEGNFVREAELWSLLNDLATVTTHYHRSHEKVGDIRP